ncbi:hypothetical protein PanWU01x14_356070 [Parasponia andersonii]|uniref:Uncharacterized protein n=1 Tax=Parasponia andersonii TaxID=3476 RepID=A0A2P5A919_PARAD|nr:hypothetical protein PanWU01x14_356070 [Parasponia andersonii]
MSSLTYPISITWIASRDCTRGATWVRRIGRDKKIECRRKMERGFPQPKKLAVVNCLNGLVLPRVSWKITSLICFS